MAQKFNDYDVTITSNPQPLNSNINIALNKMQCSGGIATFFLNNEDIDPKFFNMCKEVGFVIKEFEKTTHFAIDQKKVKDVGVKNSGSELDRFASLINSAISQKENSKRIV